MPEQTQKHETSVKETLTSIMISFIVALVFRGFVIEGFQIPTGSMGPTLLGAHVDIHSDLSGYNWPLEPWRHYPGTSTPTPGQENINPTDPITGIELPASNYKKRSGDRVFVFKYLEPIFTPHRWDVTVFKVPTATAENYIKRMIGTPNEQLAIVDGDIFTRPAQDKPAGWSQSGWHIERKPERIQRAVWQTVFDSTFAPANSMSYRSPWKSDSSAWQGLDAGPTYTYDATAPTTLTWLNRAQRLDDYLPFNEIPNGSGQDWNRIRGLEVYPVSDVSLSFGFEPDTDTSTVSTILSTRSHEFRATIVRDGSKVTAIIDSRAVTEADSKWHQIDTAQVKGNILAAGRVTDIEFWHADQAIWLFADSKLIAGGPEKGAYNWDIAERVKYTMGEDLALALDQDTQGRIRLTSPSLYPVPTLYVNFAGSPFKLHRVRVQRDLFYRPATFRATKWPGDPAAMSGFPALATHPASPLILGPDEFFMCGDNSARSLDGRLWGAAHPTILDRYHTGPGRVHRDLLIGKAFVVYFPAIRRRFGIPVLDFGNMRWIW